VKYDVEVNRAIAHWAPVYGVSISPSLVHAIIERESGHGRALVTIEPHGHKSYGPMMVLDSTAATFGIQDPTMLSARPAIGIWYGVRQFAKLLQQFGGDTERAISAYNTGAGRAKLSTSGTYPNQAYIDSVLDFWNRYQGTAIAAATPMALPFLALGGLLLIARELDRRAMG
jgi:soluble lytic murein transglycosylase-like protein